MAFSPCDGTIPDNWQLPDIDADIKKTPQGVEIDWRGSTPPTPLVGTLKILENLPSKLVMKARFPHIPIHLLPYLKEDGWSWEILSNDDKGALLMIYREDDTQ